MRSRLSIPALALSVIGLAASIASLVDYLLPMPTFCTASGCATVRASVWAHPLGVPMPAVGVAYFATMVVLAFVARPRLRLALAIAGGAWALGLVALQAFVLGAWCTLCLVADPAAIVLAIVIAARPGTLRFSWPRVALVIPAVAALTLGLFGVLHSPAPSIPAGTPECIAREQVPGQVTVVEFDDFECPFCRALHPKLAEALAHASAPIRVVRKMVPLGQHPHARTAALAWCCADAQGRGDAMATALFAAPPDELTPDGCERIATQVGCDVTRYRATLADPQTAARLAHDTADAKAAGIKGFPTIYIGSTQVAGDDHSSDELLAIVEHAQR